MIVIDASAIVLGLMHDGDARQALAGDDLAVPHLADAEVAQALRAQARRGRLSSHDAGRTLERWAQLGVRREATNGLLGRVWELRDNLSAYDACYAALAEALDCALVTADTRMAGAHGPHCPVTLLKS